MFKVTKVQTKIPSNFITGMRIGNQVLMQNKEEILTGLEQQLQQEYNISYAPLLSSINSAIYALSGASKKDSARNSYKAYVKFEKQVILLLSKEAQPIPTSLLTIVNDQNSGSVQFIHKTNMQQAVSNKGASHIYSGLKSDGNSLKRGYYRLEASELLSEHFQKFYNSVKNHSVYQAYQKNPKSLAQIHGFIAEAFVSHIALNHAQLLQRSTNPEILQQKLPDDFMQDEIDAIVKASTNRDRWTSGGDVILVNQDGEILLNIQVKATIMRASTVGNLSRAELLKDLNTLKNLVLIAQKNNNVRPMLEKLYSMFQVSALMEKTDQTLNQRLSTAMKQGFGNSQV